jgi:hypothetical protein
VPWTAAAVVAWLVTAPVLVTSALVGLPSLLRIAVAMLVVAWGAILAFPERSPIGPLTRAEWASQRAIKSVSAGARAAYQTGALGDRQADFVARLEALEPPNDLWRAVKTAQLLDLRADPPQVGVGDATNRLVTWPWRDATDHRLVRLRRRLEDAQHARRLRHILHPGFDDMTSSMRYDYFFLRNLWIRFDGLKSRDGGLRLWHDDALALAALAEAVRPPDDRWRRLRDLTVEIQGLELKAAAGVLSAVQQDRLKAAGDDLREGWAKVSHRDARDLPPATGDSQSTTRT